MAVVLSVTLVVRPISAKRMVGITVLKAIVVSSVHYSGFLCNDEVPKSGLSQSTGLCCR